MHTNVTLWMASQSMNDYQRLMFLVPLPLETIQPFNTLELEVAARPRIKTQALCHGIITLHIFPGRSINKKSLKKTLSHLGPVGFSFPSLSGTKNLVWKNFGRVTSLNFTRFVLVLPWGSQAHKIPLPLWLNCWSSFEPFFLSGYFEGSWAGKKNRTAISCDFFWDALN